MQVVMDNYLEKLMSIEVQIKTVEQVIAFYIRKENDYKNEEGKVAEMMLSYCKKTRIPLEKQLIDLKTQLKEID